MSNNYFFIDGSALCAQIRQLQRARPALKQRKLLPHAFIQSFNNILNDLHGGSYKRATFYFPTGDASELDQHIERPEYRKPGAVRDVHFKFCGYKLKKSAEFTAFVDTVPQEFKERFSKSEKGVDIEMCCDALKLASASRLDRLFLLSNDGDFIPLLKTLKDFGTNTSIIHLSDVTNPNADLLREADSYDIAPGDIEILFTRNPDDRKSETKETPDDVSAFSLIPPESEKPEAEPSDLNIASDAEPSDE